MCKKKIDPVFILVKPQMGENIGASARAMLNFGFKNMRLVSPRDGWPNPRADALASGAGRVLLNASCHQTTIDACSDLTYIFATTARNRDLTKKIRSPRKAARFIKKLLDKGERVGILFGSERAGLENSDIVKARSIISIPVNISFSSINLSQSVIVLAYELFLRGVSSHAKSTTISSKENFASIIEIETLQRSLESQLDASGYFWPEEKKNSLVENLRNLIGRLPLTSSDIRTLHGMFKTLHTKSKKLNQDP